MPNSIRRIRALARIILLDGLRRNALIGLILLSLAVEASGLLFFDFIHRDIGRASSDFIFSIAWVSGFIFLFFHAVQVMAWDEERRVIHTLLARPISRREYVLGVFSGLAALLLVLNMLLGVIGWGTLEMIKRSVDPVYFAVFNYSYYLQAWMGLFAMEVMVLAVIMLFSGMIRGSFPVLLVSLAFYLICSGLPVVRDAIQLLDTPSGTVLGTLLVGMSVIFPDFGRLDFKDAIISNIDLPGLGQLITSYSLVISYTVLILWIACRAYGKRDLQ